MDCHQVFAKNLRDFMKDEEMSSASIGRKTKINQKTIWTLTQGTVKPTLNNCVAICEVLGLDLNLMLMDSPNPAVLREGRSLSKAFEKLASLPLEKREMIKGMIHTLHSEAT